MRPIAIALGCCLLAGCWVDFPESRLARDGRPDVRVDLPSPGHEVSVADRGDGPVKPTDAKREATPNLERGADRATDRPPTDLPPKQDQTIKKENQVCVPGSFQSCASGDKDIVTCNASGTGTETNPCGAGNKCVAAQEKCCPASGC